MYDLAPACLWLWLGVCVWGGVRPVQKFSVTVIGEGVAALARDESNLIVRATKLAFDSLGLPMPVLSFTCTNAIPFGAGLGSSSAAIVSGLYAGFALAGHAIDNNRVLQLAATLENHVDNLAPCVYGGLQVRFVHAVGRHRRAVVLWGSGGHDSSFQLAAV